MAWITRDFLCLNPKCAHEWDDLVLRSEEDQQKCPKCKHAARWVIAAPHIATYSLMSKDEQAKHLRKRSRDHTRKMLKKDPTQAAMTKKFKMKGTG